MAQRSSAGFLLAQFPSLVLQVQEVQLHTSNTKAECLITNLLKEDKKKLMITNLQNYKWLDRQGHLNQSIRGVIALIIQREGAL